MGQKPSRPNGIDNHQGPLVNIHRAVYPSGEHETQVCEYEDYGLNNLLRSCKKNPGHREFIPVDTFNVGHLPKGYRDTDLYEIIKAVADLTVRIEVRMISHRRPQFWPDTTTAYPYYSMRGNTLMRTASGKIQAVDKYVQGIDRSRLHRRLYTSCHCRKCQQSGQASEVWWEIFVLAATQTVFDNAEAGHTSCRLFYDKPYSPAVKLCDVSVHYVNIQEDWCELLCLTCDAALGDRLHERLESSHALWRKVDDKFRADKDVHRLAFIVSHPHGGPKKVSVGRWKDKAQAGDPCLFTFTYTTCTCPGSSGAAVCCVGYCGWRYYHHVHSGTLPSGLNYSGVGSLV